MSSNDNTAAQAPKQPMDKDCVEATKKWLRLFETELDSGQIAAFCAVAIGAGEQSGLEKEAITSNHPRETAAFIANIAENLECDCGSDVCPYNMGGAIIHSLARTLADHGVLPISGIQVAPAGGGGGPEKAN